ncbi:MAG: NAD(P)/FAD-dependent oxidoreductase [Clostridiales bacterium]|nr:NAD(P)/FAD-dependent oxidoreductase [Clostridiales bacterium]
MGARTVTVIGGGAAGMMAAIAASDAGSKVTLIEQNEKLGKKLFLTGKGRCNLTNACEPDELQKNVVKNPRFLYSAFGRFDNRQTMDFFESLGLKTKVERGQRVFPESDHSSDVIAALSRALRQRGVTVMLEARALEILSDGGKWTVKTDNADEIDSDALIIATGGLSYKATGSTGDGHRFAEELGHKVTDCSPSLVPLVTKEGWVKDVQGLTLKNVAVTLFYKKKKIFSDFGEMLFTHFGVSGPVVLSASTQLPPEHEDGELVLAIDLKPVLDMGQLDRRILREVEQARNRHLSNVIRTMLPSSLVPVFLGLCGLDGDKPVNAVTKEERKVIAEHLKHIELTVTGTRGWDEAVITRGGVSVKDINPSTMESKIKPGLYFCGELIDVDALTGGYNLQIAWSTGHLAGQSAAARVNQNVED